jgi:hypothetical protein
VRKTTASELTHVYTLDPAAAATTYLYNVELPGRSKVRPMKNYLFLSFSLSLFLSFVLSFFLLSFFLPDTRK